MDKMIYIAMNGAKQIMLRQATNNHNLANINTIGYKESFDTFFSDELSGYGHDSRVYSKLGDSGVNLAPGSVITTDRALDIAIAQDGYLAVQNPAGGESYTRNGQLQVSLDGILQTAKGHAVMGDAGPVSIPPYSELQIGEDGTISVRPEGDGSAALEPVDRLKLVSMEAQTVEKDEHGLFMLKGSQAEPDWTVTISDGKTEIEKIVPLPGSELAADEEMTVTSGALESSNVNPVTALVKMVSVSRHYEMQVKVLKAADEKESVATSMLRMS